MGRAWATGGLGEAPRQDNALSDAERWGLDLTDDDMHGEFEIWAWHMPAVEAFLAVQSQWTSVSHDGCVVPTGLNYANAEAGLRLAGLTISPATWGQVKLIEMGALAAMNEART